MIRGNCTLIDNSPFLGFTMRLIQISKFMSKFLRHSPEKLGIKLDSGGWVNVDSFLSACEKYNFPISKKELCEVVRTDNKTRYSFNETGDKIRANQGHSTEVDLELKEKTPPDFLYHGTVERFIDSIDKTGLNKGQRHHVHLSEDVETAKNVGSRRGKPIIAKIDCRQMLIDGYKFYQSENKVWLTDSVPRKYIWWE